MSPAPCAVTGSTGRLPSKSCRTVFPVDDVEAIASRVLQFVGDAALRARMGEAAADTARTKFDLEENIRRIEEIYAGLASG